MATTTFFQGKGCGKILIKKAEAILQEKGIYIIWCNAREVALRLYQKEDFALVGKLFDVKYAGLHIVMCKNI